MERHLSPPWKLSAEHAASGYGIPVLVNCATGEAFGPGDIVNPHPSWGYGPAYNAVSRMVKTAHLDDQARTQGSPFLAQ
jgi:hypothetical protein